MAWPETPLDPRIPFPGVRVPTYADVANDFNKYKAAAEKLSGLMVPALPVGGSTRADWNALFHCWFYETTPAFPGASWPRNDHVVFGTSSLYSADLAVCPGMMEVKEDFFAAGPKRPNPWKGTFKFGLAASAKVGYYTIVEWFMGSFYPTIHWEDIGGGKVRIRAAVDNMSDWHSATRLPQSWQDKIKQATGMTIKELFTPAPRGQVLKTKVRNLPLAAAISRNLPGGNLMPGLEDKIPLPSYGGNFTQVFHIDTVWEPTSPKPEAPEPPSPTGNSIKLPVGRGGKNRGEDVTTVQELLNLVPVDQGGAAPPFFTFGTYNNQVQMAIDRFQQKQMAKGYQDGRIDPNGATWRRLKQLAKK